MRESIFGEHKTHEYLVPRAIQIGVLSEIIAFLDHNLLQTIFTLSRDLGCVV